jgi:uncharacterized membrane protein YhaH (DUF805 family)
MAVTIYVAAQVLLHALLCIWGASGVTLVVCHFLYLLKIPAGQETRVRQLGISALAVCAGAFMVMVVIVLTVKPLHDRYRDEWSIGLMKPQKPERITD